MFQSAGIKVEERLFFPLILEGCAVYFSKLSTGAEIEDCIQMGLPAYLNLFDRKNFKSKCDKTFESSAKLLYENLNRPVSEKTYKKLFGAKIDDGDEPARIGYFIGFKVIEGAAAETSLEKIAAMTKKEMISLCKTQLKKLLMPAKR